MEHVLFKNFDPLDNKMVEILDVNGNIINSALMPNLDKDTLLKMYEIMTLGRVADIRAVQYQRQGRMLTYAPNIGQEGLQVGAAAALEEKDWLVPAFRELSMMLYKGVPLYNIYLYWYGNELGSKFPKKARVLPVNIIIGSQIAIAAGIAMAAKLEKKSEVALAVIGDGGTSIGDFNEALNFAGAFDAPLVVLIQNNQWAISTPVALQTKAKTLAQKGVAFGIKTVKVDGNDPLAVYAVMNKAVAHARANKGPVLIEAVTYRIGAHTTSDDPSLYRSSSEEEFWQAKDPIDRFKKFLIKQGYWSQKEDELLMEKHQETVASTFSEVEKTGEVPLEDIFKYTYEKMTPNQTEQYGEYKRFLKEEK